MSSDENAPMEQRILDVLAVVRPYLQQDGGDVEFVSWSADERLVHIRFLGECATCSLNIMTLQAGIQAMMKEEIPAVDRVNMVR